jgi:hypothetical protein
MRVVVLAVVAIVSPISAAVADEYHDIPWYVAHPAERKALLRRCHADAALSITFNCQNAQAASATEMMDGPAPRDLQNLILPEFQARRRAAPSQPAPGR